MVILKALCLVLLLSTALSQQTLCWDCQSTQFGICVACKPSGCRAYSSRDSTNLCVCNDGYNINNKDSNAVYCQRCFIGCKTCSGPQATSCKSCVDRFVFNSVTSSCHPPLTIQDQTIQNSYNFFGFTILSGWAVSSGPSSQDCSSTTILGRGTGTISRTFGSLNAHFEARFLFAHYIQTSTSFNSNLRITIDSSTNHDIALSVNMANSNNPAIACTTSSTNLRIQNYIDRSFPHTASSLSMAITTQGGVTYGIRQFILIIKRCNSVCSSCSGYNNTQCTGCTQSGIRIHNLVATHNGVTNDFTGTCTCSGNYYEENISSTCVLICPSVPAQTFGSNHTRKCMTSCPSNTYALTDTYVCRDDCPTSSSISGSLLFRDDLNWRCVANCPAARPYASRVHRRCYLNCPNISNTGAAIDYFAVQGFSLQCVSVCPHNSTFKLYGHQGKCIPNCPFGFYGDPSNFLCVSNCNTALSSVYPFKDTSSGVPVCVNNCPAPNYFRDNTTFTCVLSCPSTPTARYGQLTRQCVTRCQNGLFGLTFGTRKCVYYCPQGYWGQPDNNVCVNTPQGCWTASNKRYADDYTRKCVFPTSCSFGFFADNSTMKCVQRCPAPTSPTNLTGASVAQTTSKVCQLSCADPQFADIVAGFCVTDCQTQNTYSDVSSSRSCVPNCNSAGATPWADNSTWRCVSDCNETNPNLVRDSTTWRCVYKCPPGYYADRITTNNPICRAVCGTNTFGSNFSESGLFGNNSETGTCEWGCTVYPPRFADSTGGMNLCVQICTPPNFGDNTGLRKCIPLCPAGYYSQNDSSRQCVNICNPGTYGEYRMCMSNPFDCPANQFGNNRTQLCEPCNPSLGQWGDPVTKTCVTRCPLNPDYNPSNPNAQPFTYYADISIRQCVKTCNGSYTTGAPHSLSTGLYGNNDTRTCVFVCEDDNAFAQVQANNAFRVCVAKCYHTPVLHYANNHTKICGPSINCPAQQFGENTTQMCVQNCPTGTWGFADSTLRVCIGVCPGTWYGQNSTGINICTQLCTTLPSLFSNPLNKLCVPQCPIASNGTLYFADPTTRSCVTRCPLPYYAHTPDRTCILVCPTAYFGKNITSGTTYGQCVTPSSSCGSSLVADNYLRMCVGLTQCTGPNPISTFEYWPDCLQQCPPNYFSNTHAGNRNCVAKCPPTSSGIAAPDLYGDNSTKSCVSRCVTPNTWADYQTRYCQPICSALPIPTYSQNFNLRCVISLSCPTSPVITFGDNNTRSCLNNCTQGKFGDPTSRNCVTQCPNNTSPHGTTYYSDISTRIYLCVFICPVIPRLFGFNDTNTCVGTCPQPLYGDQTGNRSCVRYCPLIGAVVHFAQNTSRICVTVCQNGTWGYTASRQCVLSPFDCLAQWADSSTNLCVDVCPATVGTFGDPTTKRCVLKCPQNYYSDLSTRLCVHTCPAGIQQHGTFANNQTRICEQVCSNVNVTIMTFADPQTVNRSCVLSCTQSPYQAFADPSTRTCVSICPTFPSLYGQTSTFRCVANCTGSTYADTHTRRCELGCPGAQFKSRNPNICVSVCPFDGVVPMYGDSNSGFCEAECTNSWYKYNTLSICVSSCATYSFYAFNWTCVKLCPIGFYANSAGICVNPCPSGFGQNTTTSCVSTCITGYSSNAVCVAICPLGTYGQGRACVSSCAVLGNTASNITRLCVANCYNGTFSQGGQCVTNCSSNTYADPLTHQCTGSCSSGYGDPTTNTCVAFCPTGYYTDGIFCKTGCTSTKYADNITWSCTTRCSDGYWGHSNLCIQRCPPGFFGYVSDRICYDIANIPSTSPMHFADNNTQTWVQVCPLSPLTFGDRTLKYCINQCLSSTTQFGDPVSRQCQINCVNPKYFADPISRTCVLACPRGYFANPNNNKCQTICTWGNAYMFEHTCVSTCPAPFSAYNNGTANLCVSRCPTNFFSYNRVCYSGCTNSLYYADNSTNQCVLTCVQSFASFDSKKCVTSCASFATKTLADNSTNTCVDLCPSEPDSYSQNNICVYYCSGGRFADPTPGVRECKTKCTDGLYGNPISGRCQLKCPLGFWAQDGINLCVRVCTGQFADNSTGKCRTTCPTPTYADTTTNRCVKTCPGNYFGQVNNTCLTSCTLPNYANPLTRRCESQCPKFDGLFAQNTTASCVKDCSIVTNSYADRNNNRCVRDCTLGQEYALDVPAICTSLCPSGLFMENSTKKCVPTCLTGFAEPTTRYCVARCFGDPQTFGYDKVCHYRCKNSTYNLYADNSTNLCVLPCPNNPDFYSDPLSGNCVYFCPQGLFAQNDTRTCTPQCTVGFADNMTRRCVDTCPAQSQLTFGQPNSKKCVRVCPTGMVADNSTLRCVNTNACPINTWSDSISKFCVSRCFSQPLTWGHNGSTTCVGRCPLGLFGDYQTQTCVSTCYPAPSGQFRFADPVTQTCVFVCPIQANLYGDTLVTGNFSCLPTCTGGQLRDNSTQRCVTTCPSKPCYWADANSGNCVYTCPQGYFANNQANRRCVNNCSGLFTFADLNNSQCTAYCPQNTWADNNSYICVTRCPSSPDYYADNITRTCVFHCPKGQNWTTFADPVSRRCVTKCPSGYYGINSTQRCDTGCPASQYADPTIRVCVQHCTVRPHYYKHTDRTCVFQCPSPPVSYKHNVNHSCVYTDGAGHTGCPTNYWGNTLNYTCTTLCPQGYYADQVKHICVDQCPFGRFADPVDRLCKGTCSSAPQSYRLDVSPGICVQFCPSPYFADNTTYDCVITCNNTGSGVKYAYNITRTCVIWCPPPYYSYLPDHQCILNCPPGYYAQDSTRSCETTCESPFFADDSTNKCVPICPQPYQYFGHGRICRAGCPGGTFEDNSTRMCVTQCPSQPLTFADNSTNKCVFNCPSTHNLFADNSTRICVLNCPNGTFAQTTTRTCVSKCPQQLNTYADPSSGACQPICPPPYYASDLNKQCVQICPFTPVRTYSRNITGFPRKCQTTCPTGSFAQNISRSCASECPKDLTAFEDDIINVCVSTCPFGRFALNSSFKCQRQCPKGLFADNTTRRCVANCPGSQRLYADSTTDSCVRQCPPTTYGNDQNWTCISSCPPSVSGYKLDLANLCVQQCPDPFFAFVPTRTCVTNCGNGLYGNTATRICKDCPPQCPTCLSLSQCLSCNATLYLSFGACMPVCPVGTYSNNASMTCVFATSCPAGMFGNNDTKACSTTCPNKQYPDPRTKLCSHCPQTCSQCSSTKVCTACVSTAVFSDVTTLCYSHCSSTQRYRFNLLCYDNCPVGTYVDFTGVNCQACNSLCRTCAIFATNCTSCSTNFLLNNTCIIKCPPGYYGVNSTCQACTPSITACAQPLSFKVITRIQNFQTVTYLKFNQDVDISGDINTLIKIDVKPSRLLQSSVINGGLPYTAQVMPDGTIKLILSPDVSLTNPSFTIKINDPSRIRTPSGNSLQTLQAQLNDIIINNYPAGSGADSPMAIAGTILSIIMLVVLATVLLCTPISTYLTLQAFQMIAFLAFINDLPPNLFFFLKKLSLSRLAFLPNIYQKIYIDPITFFQNTPTRVIQVNTYASFSVNAGSYLFILLIYAAISLIIFGLSTKKNDNRPLRQVFQTIWHTRVKYGIINDFLWLFALNILVQGFMQFYYPNNPGDVAITVISLLLVLFLIVFMVIHRCKYYDQQNSQVVSNYSLWYQGLKQGTIYQCTIFFYYFRKILFAVVVVASMKSPSQIQGILLVVVFAVTLLALVIVRPYKDHLRNIVHIANQVGLTFLASAMIYYKHYVDIKEPVGTKIICGTIITIVIIVHLSIAIIWALYRIYHFYKDLYATLKTTQFYKLYLDDKYEDSIQKQLQDLNDQSGQVQSIQVTSNTQAQLKEQGEEIIKLKIKRKRKIQKNKPKEEQILKPNRRQGEYLRLRQINQHQADVSELEIKMPQTIKPKFQKMVFDESPRIAAPRQPTQQEEKGEWQPIKSEMASNNNIFEPIINISDRQSDRNQDFSPANHDQLIGNNAPQDVELVDIDQISSVSNKEEIVSKGDSDSIRQSLHQIGSNSRSEAPQIIDDQSGLNNYETPVLPVGKFTKKDREDIPDEWQMLGSEIDSRPAASRQQSRQSGREPQEQWQPVQSQRNKSVYDEEQPPIIKQEEPQEENKDESKGANAWNLQIEDLIEEQNKETKGKNMMLLFDEEDFD